MKDIKKHLTFITFLLILFLISKWLSQEQLQNNELNRQVLQQIQNLSVELNNFYHSNPFFITFLFCFSFFIVTILYIPFTGSIYVLFAGAIFGLYKGTILFSFLVSISYSASFLISRYFLHDFIRKRLGKRRQKIVEEFEKDGVVYLLSVRFAGVIPGAVVNTVMSITNVSLLQFYLTTQIGTLPHIVVMVYAGSALANMQNLNSLMPKNFLIIIILLSIAPIFLKIIFDNILKIKKNRRI